LSGKYFIGIDGGGSKCKAIIVDENNQLLGTGLTGSANPFHDYEQTIFSIEQAALQALKYAGLSHLGLNQLYAGLGLAGVNLPSVFNKMQQWEHPFKQMFLTTDLMIACLGAHKGSDGAVIVTGTGSCGYINVNGKSSMLGGHGFPYGDKGSGAWLGFQAIEKVLLSLDHLTDKTLLSDKILSCLSVNNSLEIVEKVAGKPACFFATLASVVFESAEQGDHLAISILKEGADYLNKMSILLMKENITRLSMIGGISSLIQPWLSDELQQLLSPPALTPEFGAILFTQQKLGHHHG
jgi:glucosamine kinase